LVHDGYISREQQARETEMTATQTRTVGHAVIVAKAIVRRAREHAATHGLSTEQAEALIGRSLVAYLNQHPEMRGPRGQAFERIATR
jgi:hypothetical protein